MNLCRRRNTGRLGESRGQGVCGGRGARCRSRGSTVPWRKVPWGVLGRWLPGASVGIGQRCVRHWGPSSASPPRGAAAPGAARPSAPPSRSSPATTEAPCSNSNNHRVRTQPSGKRSSPGERQRAHQVPKRFLAMESKRGAISCQIFSRCSLIRSRGRPSEPATVTAQADRCCTHELQRSTSGRVMFCAHQTISAHMRCSSTGLRFCGAGPLRFGRPSATAIPSRLVRGTARQA